MIRPDFSIITKGLQIVWDLHYAGDCIHDCPACYAMQILTDLGSGKEYEDIFNQRSNMILGIKPTVAIPKPIGARIIVVPITTTLTIEERARRTISAHNNKPLVAIVADKEKPRNTLGVIVKLSIDPIIEENFKVGQGVYFGPLSGTELHFEGKTFRSLEFQEIISTVEEEELPEPYKLQVRHFLLSPSSADEL